MTEQRKWRDAKMPQWVKDSIEAEIASRKLTAALSWPTEVKPTPISFSWGAYDKLTGEPAPGRYYTTTSGTGPTTFELDHSKNVQFKNEVRSYREWAFNSNDYIGWTTAVVRGPLFDNERDARLYMLWLKCEEFAKALMWLKDRL